MAMKIVQGDKKVFDIFILDEDGRPKDISDWDMYHICIPYSAGVLEVSETINANDSIITLVSAERGELRVTIFPEDTAILTEGLFDVQVTLDASPSNPKSEVLVEAVEVVAAVCELA